MSVCYSPPAPGPLPDDAAPCTRPPTLLPLGSWGVTFHTSAEKTVWLLSGAGAGTFPQREPESTLWALQGPRESSNGQGSTVGGAESQ